MRVKDTAKWGLQIAEMIFQARSTGARNYAKKTAGRESCKEEFSVSRACLESLQKERPAGELPVFQGEYK